MDTRLYLVRIDMYINGIEVYKFRGTTHFIRVPRLLMEKRIFFSTNGIGTIKYHTQKFSYIPIL